jgi:hypothetical protein
VPRVNAVMRWGSADGSPVPQHGLGSRTQRVPISPTSDSILCLTASPRPLRVATNARQLLVALRASSIASAPFTAYYWGFVSWAPFPAVGGDAKGNPLMMPGGSEAGT